VSPEGELGIDFLVYRTRTYKLAHTS